MNVAVIGAGTVGTAIAVLLERAGHRIVGISGRAETRGRASSYLPGVPFLEPAAAAAQAELVVIGTPDDVIEQTAEALAVAAAVGPGTVVTHLSGSLGLEVLRTAGEAGARILAIHPLQTFPDVDSALEGLPGCPIAVTAEDDDGSLLGEQLAGDVQGVPFRLANDLRPLYHAAAVFASNYLVTTSAIAESLFAAAGVPDASRAMAPLQRASLEHVEHRGSAHALTGPAVRGDAGTIRRNLEALERHAPGLVPPYVAMARATLDLAERSGRLPSRSRVAVEDVLDAWS
ncbi:MAG: DUF2520 domain-containing protein [Actinobacteria bacterium]|nr:DUF2520 domain-containing protein [Actinomycetota bacterium]